LIIYNLFFLEDIMRTVANRIPIVNHQGPDFDSMSSTFKLLKALGKTLNSPDIVYKFVEAGCCLSPQKPQKIMPYHLDTGYIYDPENGYLDHHQDLERWPSAARGVWEAYEALRSDPIMGDLADLTDNVDSAGRVGREDDEARDKRESYRARISEFNASHSESRILLITERPGPKSLPTVIANMESEIREIEDRDKLFIGMTLIENWYNQEAKIRAGQIPEENFDLGSFDRIVATFINLMNTNQWLYNTAHDEIDNMYATAQKNGFISAAESALENVPISFPYRYVMKEIVDLVNQLYKTGSTYPQNPETDQMIQSIKEELADFNSNRERKVVPIIMRSGPWEIIDHYPNSNYSKRVQIHTILFMLRSYCNRRTIRSKINRMLGDCRFFEVNGIKYLDFPSTAFTTKSLRFQLRHNHQSRVDVSIGTHVNPYTNEQTLSLTKIQDGPLLGIEDLYQQLVKIEPTAEIALIGGQEKFAIYIKSRLDVFTPEVVKQVATRTLKGQAVPEIPAQCMQ